MRNTDQATLQSDVFNPDANGAPGGGGPVELRQCGTTSYDKTVWYDFYPHLNGGMRVRAGGFDTVITVMPFNRRTFRPDFSRAQCVNASSGTLEEFGVIVRGGGSYTVQLGGVGGVSGNLEAQFDFVADRDLDGVEDRLDRCDRLRGPDRRAGCPAVVRAEVVLRARPTANGIEVLAFSVTATRRARVEVVCSRGCRREVRRAGTVSFRSIRGRSLRAGSRIIVRATKRGAIGAYVSYTVLRGNIKKSERCMNPGSRRPRRRCG